MKGDIEKGICASLPTKITSALCLAEIEPHLRRGRNLPKENKKKVLLVNSTKVMQVVFRVGSRKIYGE